ncbi:MAG: ComF family protein [Methylacidiphilales bacterium]|nr:ComF family protein [Candidatus Methylacidiphilales bacterium]MDW8349895.1 ComF family protein [Verrucomicrobiae bacterium]
MPTLASLIPPILISFIETTIRDTLDLLFPPTDTSTFDLIPIHRPFCHRCAAPIFTPIHPDNPIPIPSCRNCADFIRYLDWARAPYQEKGTVRQAIIQYKYQNVHTWLPHLISWIEEAYRQFAAHLPWDGVVPVPLHPIRKADRTFNQSEDLALALSKHHQLPYLPCLQRIIHTPKQSLLTRSERLQNLNQALILNPKFDVHGLSLLIIDDVLTTGATAEACAHILKKHGARFVAALTIARA